MRVLYSQPPAKFLDWELMKIAVTGGAGFIGLHLIKHLVTKGHEVVSLDNCNDYYSRELKQIRKSIVESDYGVSIDLVDISKVDEVRRFLQKNTPETVIHLAAQAGVRLPFQQNDRYISSNLTGFANVLTECVLLEVPNFLYASSSSVYGNSSKIPYSETETKLTPVSFYGATKLANEVLSPTLVAGSNTRARGLRLFTVYGSYGRPDMAYFRLFASALEGSAFSIFGDGTVQRDFTYVSDVTRAIELLNLELSNRDKGFSDVVNIGGGKPISLIQMIKTVESITNTSINLKFSESNSSDVLITSCSSDYLQSLTNFVPRVDIESGLMEVYQWAKNYTVKNDLSNWSHSVN
jgi:UDP-glucuronate 4-epimerase